MQREASDSVKDSFMKRRVRRVHIILSNIIKKYLLSFFYEHNAVKDVAEYLKISRSEALQRARIKDTVGEDCLWNAYNRLSKEDYRDYYNKNIHYLERQDWYNGADNK